MKVVCLQSKKKRIAKNFCYPFIVPKKSLWEEHIARRFFYFVVLQGNNAKNPSAENHQDNVKNPDDIPAENNAQDTRKNLSFRKTRNKSEDPRCNGDDRKNNADQPSKTEIIAFAFCHIKFSFKDFLPYIIATS